MNKQQNLRKTHTCYKFKTKVHISMQRKDTMAQNQSWSLEHIRHIIARLDKNHVNITIHSNDFEETKAMDTIYQTPDDPYRDFDEFSLQPFAHTHTPQVVNVANGLLAIVRCLMQNANLKDVKLFIDTLKMYTDATLVKDLHITKYKLSKKKLKEDLDSIEKHLYDNGWVKDNFDSMTKCILVAFSRCYGCSMYIEGECEMHIESVSAHTQLHLKLSGGVCSCVTF